MTLVKVNEPEWKQLHRIADSLRPQLQQELFNALDALKKQIPTASLVDLIEDGQLAQVLAAVKLDPPDLTALQDAIAQIVAQSGTRAIANVEQLFPLRFDLVNPDAVSVIGSERWAQEYGRIGERTNQLIQEVNRETQQAVSEIVQRGFLEGQANFTVVNSAYNYGWGWFDPLGGYVSSQTYLNQWKEGTLMIDIVDARKEQLVWRGMGTGAIDPDRSLERKQDDMNDTARRILKDFPPSGS